MLHVTGFEWCLGLLEREVYDDYQRGEEDFPLDHHETKVKLVRLLDASGRCARHLPDEMQVTSAELAYW